jgi:colanic acid/amylovoran biosynthesis glycosyltransferase
METTLAGRGAEQRPATLALVYVIGTYPVPTTTFIDREIRALRRAGADIRLVSLRRPTHRLSSDQRELASGVEYVLPARTGAVIRSHLGFLRSRPGVYVRTFAHVVSRPHPSLRARARTVLHFGMGVHVAAMIRDRNPGVHIHAHFVDRAALVALVAGRLLDAPFSATAHANDIYVDPVLLPEKLSEATFVVTCTRFNQEHLASIPGGGSVRCIYHGVEVGRLRADRSGAPRSRPLVLSIGQLKEKKGFRYLIEACRILSDRGIDFDCQIVGDGPLRADLAAQIATSSLGDHVRLTGALPHDRVLELFDESAVFALACVTGANGDRDGIPNVILEAMAKEVPVVSTRHSGIPEAVEDGESGLLVPTGDAAALADALEQLLGDPAMRERLGRRGRAVVEERFDVDRNARALLEGFAA